MKTTCIFAIIFIFFTSCERPNINSIPVVIGYSELDFLYNNNGKKIKYENPKYAIVKNYADKINKQIDHSKSSISILLASEGFDRYATSPDYEIEGTDLLIHISPMLKFKPTKDEWELIEICLKKELDLLAKEVNGSIIKFDFFTKVRKRNFWNTEIEKKSKKEN